MWTLDLHASFFASRLGAQVKLASWKIVPVETNLASAANEGNVKREQILVIATFLAMH